MQHAWIPVQTAYLRLQRENRIPAFQFRFGFRQLLVGLCDLWLPPIRLPPYETVYDNRNSRCLNLLQSIFWPIRVQAENSLNHVRDHVGKVNNLQKSAISTHSDPGFNHI